MTSNIKKCFLFMLGFSLFAQNSFGLSPVILIPGDGGSQLEAKINKTNVVHYICDKTSSDFYNVWLNLELLVPFVIDCWIDNVRLEYNNVTRTTSNPKGVQIRVPGWGNPEPVEWLDPSHDSEGAYFNTIGDALVKIGYVRNVSLRGAPYDFRKAPNENGEFFVKLKALVEETYAMNNKTAVTFLVHSMGGSMALHFLRLQSQGWKNQYIRRMISLSTPWGGAVKALKVFAIGDDLGSLVLSGSTLRAQQVTYPSLAWLLPAARLWGESEHLVTTDKYNFTIHDLQKLFSYMDLPDAWEMRRDTEKYSSDDTAPGVEVHCLYGTNISTVERLDYKAGTWLDGKPTLVTGDGDGTVNLRSLANCERWGKPDRRGLATGGVRVVGARAAGGARSSGGARAVGGVRARGGTRSVGGARARGGARTTPWVRERSSARASLKVLPLAGAEHLKILHDPRVVQYITTVLAIP